MILAVGVGIRTQQENVAVVDEDLVIGQKVLTLC